jgi:hypothetical protein
VGDILGEPGLGDLLFDERLLGLARALVPTSELVYFGDSGIMVGGNGRGFHKDNTCRDDATHADWCSPYTLVRFGVYLEDHDRWSGGLKVRRGSHMHVDDTSGKIVDVPTRAGDVVVWSLRLTHSGHVVRLRGLPHVRLQPRLEIRAPSFLHVPEQTERRAIFITMGQDDAHLHNFVQKHVDLDAYPENYIYKRWLYSATGPEYDARAAKAGIRLMRPIADYGTLYAAREPVPSGIVPVGASRADLYVPRGFEAVVRRMGKTVRALRSSLAR